MRALGVDLTGVALGIAAASLVTIAAASPPVPQPGKGQFGDPTMRRTVGLVRVDIALPGNHTLAKQAQLVDFPDMGFVKVAWHDGMTSGSIAFTDDRVVGWVDTGHEVLSVVRALKTRSELASTSARDTTTVSVTAVRAPDLLDEHAGCVVQPAADVLEVGPAMPFGESDNRTVLTPPATVDVLICGMQEAVSSVGGASGFFARASTLLDKANAACTNSSLLVTFNPVGYVLLPENETQSSATDINDLLTLVRTFGDDELETVHSWREALNADLTSVVFSAAAGIPSLQVLGVTSGFTGSSSQAFSVVTTAGFSPFGETLHHEWGHNFGAAHGRGQDGSGPPFRPFGYGHGWIRPDTGGETGSIMYTGVLNRRNHYSNPDVLVDGVPSGIAISDPLNSAHVVQAITDTAPTVAGFRSGPSNFEDCDGDSIFDVAQIRLAAGTYDLDTNGLIDSCEIASEPSLDCDGNGVLDSVELAREVSCEPVDRDANDVLDSCQIAEDSGLDCNTDGILDVAQVEWTASGVMENKTVRPWLLGGQEVCVPTSALAGSDLVITVAAKVRLGSPERLELRVNGTFHSYVFNGTWQDCVVNEATVVVPGAGVTVGPEGLLRFGIGTELNFVQPPCGADDFVRVSWSITRPSEVDTNRNGLVDCVAGECGLADVIEPFGVVDSGDLGHFISQYAAASPSADIATPFGPPDASDLQRFIDAFFAGCN